jgi:MSHA biogenesis protein MshL
MTRALVKSWPRIGAGVALAVALAACTSTGQHRDTPQSDAKTLDRIQAELDTGGKPSADEPPEEVQRALMPEGDPGLPAQLEETRFDLDVAKAPARAFFMGLVDGTPYNMVVHPDVGGRISLELKDVTVPEVMAIARRVYGYQYDERSNGYIVMPAKMQSRIFEVDYLDIKRGGESNTRVSSGQVSDAGSTGGGDSGGDSDSSSGSNGGSGTKEQNPGSRISTQSESAFWSGLERSVRSIIGASQDRSVVVDPEAGLVIVRAMPGELRDVQQYLKRAEARLQRQVVLEAKVLEVRLSESNQAGINWQGLLQADNGDQYAVGQSSVDSGSTNAGAVANPVANLLNPSATVGNPDFGSLFSLGANTNDFNALIQLLNTQGDVQVLSSPRVSTLNNQKAVIKVGSDEFFVTDVQSERNTGTGTATQSIDVELTPFFSGIALDVTPQVGSDGEVTLHVHPSVSEVRDQQKSITVAGQQQSLPLAFSQVRESDSVVRASDGQVVVIGGLMQDESTQRRAQPGGLGNLPLIGGLFRQRADSSRRSELVILLRPIVADSDGDWSRQMQDFSDRLQHRSEKGGESGPTGSGSRGEDGAP